MKYRSRTQHQQTFRPVVVVLSNSILPLWYIQKVYEARQPNFQLNIDEVVLELDKAYARCKKLAKGVFKNVIWIIDVEPLTMVEQNKGKERQADREFIRYMGNLKKIYVQDKNPHAVKESIQAVLPEDHSIEIVPISNCDQFFLPKEL